jgi:hypothetical protein
LLAGLQTVFPAGWRDAAVIVQIALCGIVAGGAYQAALRLGARRGFAVAAGLLPAVGFIVVLQISLLTDALYAALFTGAALCLVAGDGLFGAIIAGLLLALATSLREVTPYLAPFFLPLACCGCGRRWARMIATILPPLCTVAALMAWNEARVGWPIVTTTAEVNMVQPLFPLITRNLPVYAGDDAFDRAARETLTRPDFDEIAPMLQRLFQQENMTAPELAEMATARYWRAWERFPRAMLRSSALRFQASFLELPFAPVDTIAGLDVFSGRHPSPDLVKLKLLWQRTVAGDVTSLIWLILVVITRSVGVTVAFVGMFGPWLRGRTWRLRALWLICAAVPAVHMPVHLDIRYLMPVVPLLCIAAAASISSARLRQPGAAALR